VCTLLGFCLLTVMLTHHTGSLLFPDFDSGFEFMERVAREECRPASIR
jgi:hypothetical protein